VLPPISGQRIVDVVLRAARARRRGGRRCAFALEGKHAAGRAWWRVGVPAMNVKATEWWVRVASMNVRCLLPGVLEVGFDCGEGWDTLSGNTSCTRHGP
jgi:hypothetical protein